jgi:hypothetical protein
MNRNDDKQLARMLLLAFLCGLLSSMISPGFLEKLVWKMVVSL